MADLIVRGVADSTVRALKQRAVRNGRSAEAEHREILAHALRGPRKRTLAETLATIPGAGRDKDFDKDFARAEDASEARRVPR